VDPATQGGAANDDASAVMKFLFSNPPWIAGCVMTTLAHMSPAMIRILSAEHTYLP
jgi:hypothetical protein